MSLRKTLMKTLADFLIAIALCLPAICAPAQTSNTPASSSSTSNANDNQAQQDSQQGQNSKNQSKKEKKKSKRSADDALTSATFSDAVAQELLQKLADGLEGYSDRLMLSTFDQNKMEGFVPFQQQVVALFRRTDSFRVHFRIMQANTEQDKGVALVEFEMEVIPRATDQQPLRKRDQLRFEMERGDKGWRIVDVQPRDFFS